VILQDTILNVTKNGLCTGCGSCAAFCPVDAIQIVKNEITGNYLAIPNRNCTNCGLCLKICPGRQVDFKALKKTIFGKDSRSILLGNYINTYVGYALDKETRYRSSSGGLVTEILCYLLENKRIDGALVIKMRKDKPLEPEPFVATSKEEVKPATGSKYCPVPANLGLKSILKSRNRRLAVVGLPCHIHGLRKAETLLEKLTGTVYLHIGIFCSNAPSFYATKFLLDKLNLKEDRIESISYRGNGWPGYLKIKLKNRGKPVLLPFSKYWNSGFGQFFCKMRCRLCIDQTNELADISLGDAWIPELMTQKNPGLSLIITRSSLSERILKEMREGGLVKLIDIDPEKTIQYANIIKKAGHNLWASSMKPNKLPKYNAELPNPTLKVILYYLLFKTGSFIADYPRLWKLLAVYKRISDNALKLLIALKGAKLMSRD